MPLWVNRKYQEAKRFFDTSNLVVISRDKRLFALSPEPVPQLSPLLIGVFPPDEFLLLAAWGLEHELPNWNMNPAQPEEG